MTSGCELELKTSNLFLTIFYAFMYCSVLGAAVYISVPAILMYIGKNQNVFHFVSNISQSKV